MNELRLAKTYAATFVASAFDEAALPHLGVMMRLSLDDPEWDLETLTAALEGLCPPVLHQALVDQERNAGRGPCRKFETGLATSAIERALRDTLPYGQLCRMQNAFGVLGHDAADSCREFERACWNVLVECGKIVALHPMLLIIAPYSAAAEAVLDDHAANTLTVFNDFGAAASGAMDLIPT